LRLGGSRWRWLGYAFVVNAVMILAFYSVVTGWTLLAFGCSLVVELPVDPAAPPRATASTWSLTSAICCAGPRSRRRRGTP
jgi:SNF family Na+-dependent transporter